MRIGLVLNGGVSLAVWIGGVVRELDAARRAADEDPADRDDTMSLYAQILGALKQRVVVDVIAGASAGGINGVLLGAAIFNGKPLGDLRETWISLGDFRKLLRSPSSANPPSLMQGDEIVLPELRKFLAEAYEGNSTGPDQDLYVYVTATDVFGYTTEFSDTTGRTFAERDHRRVFRFEHQPSDSAEHRVPKERRAVMRDAVWLGDPDAPELLARAGRGSSSFPVAFEAHGLDIVDHEGGQEIVNAHWLVDGGILDNQPFNPVLDRIAVLPAEKPTKRVVLYVVPYVTEVGSTQNRALELVTARETYSAAGRLPRDLPKLQSLRRIEREFAVQKVAEEARRRLRPQLTPAVLQASATALFEAYVETRATAADAVWRLWASPNFHPGHGTIAQDPSTDAQSLAPPPRPDVAAAERAAEGQPRPPWLPPGREWPNNQTWWAWGLAPAERVAFWALMYLRDVENPDNEEALDRARARASRLIARVRQVKIELREAFERTSEPPVVSVFQQLKADILRRPGHEPEHRGPNRRAHEAYEEIEPQLKELQSEFRALDADIQAAGGKPSPLRVQSLLDYEVARNAIEIQDEQLGSPFEFIFASAGVANSLGHVACEPIEKLAGMKLGHFGGFLKRSWRANDWLWGRLDGVEHVLRAVLDVDRLRAVPTARTELAKVALGATASEEEQKELQHVWRQNAKNLGLRLYAEGEPLEQFEQAMAQAEAQTTKESGMCLELCRRALAARIQLRVLRVDLGRVADTAADDLRTGSSQIAGGGYWASRFFTRDRNLGGRRQRDLSASDRVALFKELNIGSEDVRDEASSRLSMEVGSQLVAVAAAMTAGDRGGLPAGVRGTLGVVRGLTLASSRVFHVLARTPWFGAVIFAVLVGLVVFAASVDNTLIGTLVPALALLAVVTGVALLTLATSVLEQGLTTTRKVFAYLVFAGVPLAFVLTVKGPSRFQWERFATFLEDHVGSTATSIACGFAAAAFGLAALRLIGSPIARLYARYSRRRRSFRWRRMAVTGYRIAVFAALLTLAIGFVLERINHVKTTSGGWLDVADERKGAIVVVSLVAVLLFSSLMLELAAAANERRHRLRRPG